MVTLSPLQRTRSQSLKTPGGLQRASGRSQSAYHGLCNTSSESRNLKDDEDWTRVQAAVSGLFHRKKLRENQLFELRQCIRNLLGSNVGPFLFEFYTKQAIIQGMHILKEKLQAHSGSVLLTVLEETWSYFYTETIPTLQAIFFPIKMNLRRVILASFRDVIVLKIPVKEALEEADRQVPSGIKQMLLILQNVQDTFPPNANRLLLEKLVALVVVPYLGFQGLYDGLSEPVIWSKESVLHGKKTRRHRVLQRQLSVKTFSPIQESYSLEDMFQRAYAHSEEED